MEQDKLIIHSENPLQIELTQKWIQPNTEFILEDFWTLRHAIDALFFNRLVPEKLKEPSPIEHSDSKAQSLALDERLLEIATQQRDRFDDESFGAYPIGACYVISKIALKYLSLIMESTKMKGFSILNQFIEEGGVFKMVWGEIRKEYFQTAFQVGTMFFDISNDTVDLNKPKVMCAQLDGSDFNNIESIVVFARIFESYHKKNVFINHCFPNLAPFFPIISTNQSKKRTILESSKSIKQITFDSNFEKSRNFIFKSEFSHKLLPKQNLERIIHVFKTTKGPKSLTEMMECKNTSLDELEKIFSIYQHLDEKEKKNKYKEAKKAANYIDKIFRFMYQKNSKASINI